MGVEEILEKGTLEKQDLVTMLGAEGDQQTMLLGEADRIRRREVGSLVHFRGLVEFSNICGKDCYYCGIRRSNRVTRRYDLTDEQILDAARYAWKHDYGSFIMQSGERTSRDFTSRIEHLLRQIKDLSGGALGITLSLGEQSSEVYERWFEAGAHRYLLRIETSSPELYRIYHPGDALHDYQRRLECLYTLRDVGYQTGTGVMIGLPFQGRADLADDLLFMRDFDVDMVGMGPYIEHRDTPIYAYRHLLQPIGKRFDLALNMIACLRILMPDINIAASTALQAINPLGREKAVQAGANIIMPNITPGRFRNDYALYENKPCVDETPDEYLDCPDVRLNLADAEIGYGQWGDSKHYFRRVDNLKQPHNS